MSARYIDPRIVMDAGARVGGLAYAEFGLRNETAETWRAAEGFRVGYHLFDANTGTLIVDGPREELERDVAPGETAQVRLGFEVPPEDGRYRVLISPMREGVRWYYETGWPALAVEAWTEGGVSRVEAARVTTAAALRRKNAVRAVGRALVYPWLTIWRNRGLIRVMVRRDILGRYRGSFGGSFWTVFNPLLLILTYFFVFGFVLNPDKDHTAGFALYLLGGMLPWLAFSEAVGRSPTVMLEHRNFVKKLVFAVETLPVNLVFAGLVTECFAAAAVLRIPVVVGARLAGDDSVATGAADSADDVHGRPVLVSGGVGRVLPGLRTDHRIPADHLVFPDADLLPRGDVTIARPVDRQVTLQEPDVPTGGRIPIDLPMAPDAGVRAPVEVLGAGASGVRAGARVVL